MSKRPDEETAINGMRHQRVNSHRIDSVASIFNDNNKNAIDDLPKMIFSKVMGKNAGPLE